VLEVDIGGVEDIGLGTLAAAADKVAVIGLKCPKLPVALLSMPVRENKWIVPVSLEAQRIVELSLKARQ
jgi:hypothetical protein